MCFKKTPSMALICSFNRVTRPDWIGGSIHSVETGSGGVADLLWFLYVPYSAFEYDILPSVGSAEVREKFLYCKLGKERA